MDASYHLDPKPEVQFVKLLMGEFSFSHVYIPVCSLNVPFPTYSCLPSSHSCFDGNAFQSRFSGRTHEAASLLQVVWPAQDEVPNVLHRARPSLPGQFQRHRHVSSIGILDSSCVLLLFPLRMCSGICACKTVPASALLIE